MYWNGWNIINRKHDLSSSLSSTQYCWWSTIKLNRRDNLVRSSWCAPTIYDLTIHHHYHLVDSYVRMLTLSTAEFWTNALYSLRFLPYDISFYCSTVNLQRDAACKSTRSDLTWNLWRLDWRWLRFWCDLTFLSISLKWPWPDLFLHSLLQHRVKRLPPLCDNTLTLEFLYTASF